MGDKINIHPGEILLEEFLKPLGISQNRLANAMNVSPRRINDIVHGRRAVTADLAVRLSAALGTTARFWTGLQIEYDFREAELRLSGELSRIPPLTRYDAGAVCGRTDDHVSSE